MMESRSGSMEGVPYCSLSTRATLVLRARIRGAQFVFV